MLAQRVASAIAGVPLILLLIYAGDRWYVAAVAAIVAVACLEFQHARFGWTHPVSLLTAAFCAAMAGGAHVGLEWVVWFLAGAVVLTLGAMLYRFEAETSLLDWLWASSGVLYVGFLGSFMVLLRDLPGGRDWVYLTVLSTFAADTAAYFGGRAVGSRALAPRISPHKTIEGAVFGWGGGFAAVLLCNYLLGLRIDAGDAVMLGAVLPAAAMVGDLAESAMKRGMHLKDASELIPGHGGLLDRLDSLLFTFVTVYLFVQWVLL
ncbi:MAG: phosphatidate cytidylyltransferase [Dehalococcoidia bacterium]